jgi:hypothetical protein
MVILDKATDNPMPVNVSLPLNCAITTMFSHACISELQRNSSPLEINHVSHHQWSLITFLEHIRDKLPFFILIFDDMTSKEKHV